MSTSQIALLLPSYGRPLLCEKSILKAQVLAKYPDDLYIYVGLSEDDTTKCSYTTQLKNVYYSIYPEEWSVGKIWSDMARLSIDHGADFLLMHNDDLEMQTQNWDEMVICRYKKVFPDNLGVLTYNDGINTGKNWGAFPFVSTKFVKELGYFTTDLYEFFYNDTHLLDIAKQINRHYHAADVIGFHNHWTISKTGQDETTKKHRSATGNQRHVRDTKTYRESYLSRYQDAQKLLGVIKRLKG